MKTRKQVEAFYKAQIIPIVDQLWDLCDKNGLSMLVNVSAPLPNVKACCYLSQCNVETDETPLGMILASGCAQERFDEVAAMLGRLKKTEQPGFVPGPLD